MKAKYDKVLRNVVVEKLSIWVCRLLYNKFQPRKLHTSIKGFHFNRYIWPHETVCEVLKDEGFAHTEMVPYKVDPSYCGELDLQGYADAINGNVILAWK